MKTIRFDKADVFSWESLQSTHDEWIQEAMDDSSDIAIVVRKTIDKPELDSYAGNVHGAMGPVGLYIYTMEDDDWIYVAHFIYEVEHQCFLFRHRKNTKTQGETFGVTESAIYYDENGM